MKTYYPEAIYGEAYIDFCHHLNLIVGRDKDHPYVEEAKKIARMIIPSLERERDNIKQLHEAFMWSARENAKANRSLLQRLLRME